MCEISFPLLSWKVLTEISPYPRLLYPGVYLIYTVRKVWQQDVYKKLLDKVSCGLLADAFSEACESEKSDKVVMFPVNSFVFSL